jgi:pyrroloquinoline quinone (PQQ) biosynthesis protein C
MQGAPSCDWNQANNDTQLRREILESCKVLAINAYEMNDRSALNEVHEILSIIYGSDFSVPDVQKVDCDLQPIYRDIASHLENAMLRHEIHGIDESLISGYPANGHGFVKWLKKRISSDASSVHPFYNHFLAEKAQRKDVIFYFAQETNLDPRFDDILAMMQIGTQLTQKLEIAKNYFDEMGNGEELQVHSRMFSNALNALGIDADYIRDNMLLEARASGNISACLALSRRHYYKAIGYFGVTEYLAPRRFKHVVDAWRRNNLPEEGIAYHKAHIVIDTQHAKGWFDNVVVPLIDADPAIGKEIALGAAIRLKSSSKYLDALLARLHTKPEMATI